MMHAVVISSKQKVSGSGQLKGNNVVSLLSHTRCLGDGAKWSNLGRDGLREKGRCLCGNADRT